MEEQLLLFDARELTDPQEEAIISLLSKGSPFGRWECRFMQFWQRGETTQAKAKFLKGEFGIGGCGGEGVFARWDANGMEIDCATPQPEFTRRLSWTDVAKRFDAIVASWEPFDRSEEAEEGERDRRGL